LVIDVLHAFDDGQLLVEVEGLEGHFETLTPPALLGDDEELETALLALTGSDLDFNSIVVTLLAIALHRQVDQTGDGGVLDVSHSVDLGQVVHHLHHVHCLSALHYYRVDRHLRIHYKQMGSLLGNQV
jgi:hypothetical protein